MPRNTAVKHAALLILLTLTPVAVADNWPQWRGPTRDGISTEKGLPTTWSATKNMAWTLKLPGRGSSTPCVWGDRIFLTTLENNELMLCCISTDGKLLWKTAAGKERRPPTKKDEINNEASPSPCTDGKHVYAFFGSGDFSCFDFDGKQLWHFNVQERYQTKFSMYHGVHVSPLLHEDRIYMNILHTNGYWVFAINKATGDDVWKIDRPSDARKESKESYASPVLWKNNGEWNLVVLGADYATGHRLSDGKEVWRLEDLNPKSNYSDALRIIASPLATSDQLYVPTARNGLFVTLKQGANGAIKSGSTQEAWRLAKGAPDVPSPLEHDGILYLQSAAGGTILAVDAKTGKNIYTERLITGKAQERFRASPIYADGKIYTIARDSGTIFVLKAGPKFELLGTNVMPDEIPASPVVANGRLYIRGMRTLYAISEGGK